MNINSMETPYCEGHIFEAIFEKGIKNYNISNVNIYEIIYFLNFLARNSWSIFSDGIAIVHPSWKSRRIWKEIMQTINQ
jgi:hypothetical protein